MPKPWVSVQVCSKASTQHKCIFISVAGCQRSSCWQSKTCCHYQRLNVPVRIPLFNFPRLWRNCERIERGSLELFHCAWRLFLPQSFARHFPSCHVGHEPATLWFHLVWGSFCFITHKLCMASLVICYWPVMEIVIGSGLSWDSFQWETLCGGLMKMCEYEPVRFHSG